MNNRIKGWIVATAVVAIVGVPLTVAAAQAQQRSTGCAGVSPPRAS